MTNFTPINRAALFAQRAQKDCDYDGESYDVHNKAVRGVLNRFGFTPSKYPYLHVAAEMHDVFEDTDATPADAIAAGIDPIGVKLAELVTDEPGETRKERKIKTYPKIVSDPEAIILKLADRIANFEYRRSTKKKMYVIEYPEFKKYLYNPNCDSKVQRMWNYLDMVMIE